MPGGGPDFSGMEARVRRLEDAFERVESVLTRVDERTQRLEVEIARVETRLLDRLDQRTRQLEVDLGGLKSEVARIDGRLANLPSTWVLLTTVIGGQIAQASLLLAAAKFLGY